MSNAPAKYKKPSVREFLARKPSFNELVEFVDELAQRRITEILGQQGGDCGGK
ncbi:hypothetical protein METP3_01256 [Methanosarcinales archaeon]|nr:MAG: hypothetical protein OI861_00040 [Candidatus Methanoperedens sp.]CAG0967931.1 hypothetical protein METP3_01256 [Methanosarcinales archaeon]